MIHADVALTPDGFRAGVRLTVARGRIATLESGVPPAPGDARAKLLLPGLANLHSHAFQRAMAGLAERRGPGVDSFWTWRSAMYRVALAMSPAAQEAVAAQLYVEMLEAGFTRVGEFHYLHHGPDGDHYDNPAEMAERIAAAAAATGIGLTLLPVFYAHAGFGGLPPLEGQRRFVNGLDAFARLHQGAAAALRGLPSAVLGVAPHSLRAVTPAELALLLALCPEGPRHIHVAEQQREVDECLAHTGARPVEWLLDHAPLGPDWCLVHATHVTPAERGAIAARGAVAGLCPITEANLGDGIFPGPEFVAEGGRYGVGSDSNVEIGAAPELRMLEYGQRLRLRARGAMATHEGSTGVQLLTHALAGGGQATGHAAALTVGAPADFCALAPDAALSDRPEDWIDGWIFAQAARVDSVWVAGERLVQDGRHRDRERIREAFVAAMDGLKAT